MAIWLVFLLACSRPATFDCGKVICDRDQVCLHWDIPDTAPPDAGHGCVEAPAACEGGVPTCECAADVCLEECDDAGDGVSCWGEEP